MHYPNQGIQHTISVVAISTFHYCLESFSSEWQFLNPDHLTQIQNLIEEISTDTRKRRFSQGAKRAINVYADHMMEICINDGMSDTEKRACWAKILWIAWGFLEEVRTTCPIYWNGEQKESWQKLYEIAFAILQIIGKHWPESEEIGSALYLQISDEMAKV